MLDRRAMLPIDILLGLLVFVGISSSISPWLDALYSEIAVWLYGGLAIVTAIWAGFKFGPDLALSRAIHKPLSPRAVAEELELSPPPVPPAPTAAKE